MSYWQGKKVLVTGATGLVGRHVSELLAGLGADVWRGSSSHDLRDPVSARTLVRDEEVVFHCAAVTSGAKDIVNNPLRHVTPNLVMAANMLEAARAAGAEKFVYVSSGSVYPPGDKPMPEDHGFFGDPWQGYYAVGWMKRAVEKLCEVYSRHGLPCVAVRPSNVYGPHDKFDPDRSHVLASLVRKTVERQDPFPVWGDGTEERDFIHVRDLARGMLLAAEKLSPADGPVNLASGAAHSVDDVMGELFDMEGWWPEEIAYDPGAPRTIPRREFCVEKAERLLGFKPEVPLRDGLRETLAWYKENRR